MVLAINKVDTVKDKARCCRVLERLERSPPTSRRSSPSPPPSGAGVDGLVRELLRAAARGAAALRADMLTDRTERFLAGELIREQLFLRLRQELPYADGRGDRRLGGARRQGDVVIDATIIVERDSQKGIVRRQGRAR